jgi:hypothetical protein
MTLAVLLYFPRSEVRLASARLPQKSLKSKSSFWRLLCPPITPRTVPLCVCSFTFADGRHCRMPRRPGNPYVLPRLTSFRMNTYKPNSQKKYLKPCRINTCEKPRGEGGDGLNANQPHARILRSRQDISLRLQHNLYCSARVSIGDIRAAR